MTKNLNKELKKYYSEIKALLPCKRSEKRAVLDLIKTAVKGYIYDHPDSGIDDIIKQIGAPNEVVQEYYSPEKAKELAEQIKRNRKITIIAAAAVVIVFVGLVALFVSQIYNDSGHLDSDVFHEVSVSDNL